MVEIKEAVQRAIDFAEQIYASKLDQPRIEEVDSTDNEWLITLSFNLPAVAGSGIRAPATGERTDRQYKIFQVNKNDGRVASMKIRELGAKRWSS